MNKPYFGLPADVPLDNIIEKLTTIKFDKVCVDTSTQSYSRLLIV